MGKFYNTIRKVHLYTSFIIGAFLLMYFITGGVLIMHDLFPRKTQEEVSQSIPISSSINEPEIISSIKKQYNISGFEKRNAKEDGRVNYSFTRPGYTAQIMLIPGNLMAEVKIQKGTFASVMNGFHRLRGFDGLPHFLWAIFYDLSCIALIIFSISGIYLWWKLMRQKTTGFIFLLVSTGLTLFTVLYLLAVG